MSGTDLIGAALLGQLGQRGQRGESERRALAARLMAPQAPVAPIYNPQAGYAHVLTQGLNALSGNLQNMQADRQNQEREDSLFGRIRELEETRGREASSMAARFRAPQGAPQTAPAPVVTPGPQGAATPAVAPEDLMPIYEEASRLTDIPAQLLIAQHRQESNFDPRARGRAGEIGLGQVLPTTARQPGFGMDPIDPARLDDPRENILWSARYLAARGRAAGVTDWNDPAQIDRALRAYNGGGDPNYVQNVRRWMPAQSGGADPNVVLTSGQGPDVRTASQSPLNMDAINEALASPNPRVRQAAQAAIESERLRLQQEAATRREQPTYRFENIGGIMYAINPQNPRDRQAVGPAGGGAQPSQADRDRARYIELDGRRDQLTPGERIELDALGSAVFGRDNIQVGPGGVAIVPAIRPTQGNNTIPTQAGAGIGSAPLAAPNNDALVGAAPAPAQRRQQEVRLPDGRTAQYIPAEQPQAPQPGNWAGILLEGGNSLRQAQLALVAATNRPQSFGAWQGMTNMVPGVLERLDPGGVETRALAANLGSLVIHQRSGAAVTAAEFPRLRPFIPQVGDPPGVVQTKLASFVREYRDLLSDQYRAFGPEAGYRPLPPVEDILRGAQQGSPGGGPRVIEYDAQGRRISR